MDAMKAKRTAAAIVVALGLLATAGATALAYDSGPEHDIIGLGQAFQRFPELQSLAHGPGTDEVVRPPDTTP